MLLPKSRTYGLTAAGVVSAGAEEAGGSAANTSRPAVSRESRTSFSRASRDRKSQSVMLGWVASSYTVGVASILPIGMRLSPASFRTMSEAVMFG